MPRLAAAVAVASLAAPLAPAEPARDARTALSEARPLAVKDHPAVIALLTPWEAVALEPRLSAEIQQLLAAARGATGDHEGALRAADAGEPLALEAKAYDLLARIEGSRGFVWGRRGFDESQLRHSEKALAWAEASGDRATMVYALGRLAAAHKGLGDWTRALDYSRRMFELDPDPSDRARVRYLIERGIALFEFHDRDEAEKSLQEALDVARHTQARDEVALASLELGKLYWTFDRDRERARQHYDQALVEATAAPAPHLAVIALNDIGNLYRDGGDPAQALLYYRRALELARAHGQAGPYLHKNIGQVLVRLGDLQDGERWLLEGLALSDSQGQKRIQWQARMELAQLYRKRDPARADRYFRETLDVIEAEHSNVLLDDLRAGSLAVSLAFYDPYDLYIGFLLEQARPADAFLVAERARARAFLATLSAAREQVATAVPATFLATEKDILRRISAQQAALRTEAPAAARREEMTAAIHRDEEQLRALRVRLAAESPRLAHARYPRLWSVDALQKEVLRPEEALAVFFLGTEASVCWIVTRDDLQAVPLPRRADLEPVVRAAMDALRSPGGDARAPARRLYDTLAAPMVAHVPEGWRLVVVPHGVLNYLPLETALDPAGRYLIERHAVSYAPSASSLAYLRAHAVAAAPDGVLLAVGDPELGGATPATERALGPELAGLLKPLAHGAEELRQIGSIFGAAARLFTRGRATEAELARVDGATVRVLHFATHGLLDDRRPDRSALALTAQPPAHDGLLQTREVFRLRLKSRLVTLSACQTALGRELTGEGLVGLARAFFYAGADAVMASLWSVDDASTTRWMADFYRRLGGGAAIDDAARAAKLGFIQGGGALAHPYHWAPFIVTGHAATGIDLRPGTRVPVPLLAGLTLLAAAAALTVWARRRRSAART